MKKNLLVFAALLAVFSFLSASVWEGAAAVSSDFPEDGLYIATNAFPKNTVVDITNLETGKTQRVIVSAGLDSPGLLALVSREAAQAIGLQSRAIGRIRMTRPADPLAKAGRDEDLSSSGDPDYDPVAAVENAYPADTDPVASGVLPVVTADPEEEAAEEAVEEAVEEAAVEEAVVEEAIEEDMAEGEIAENVEKAAEETGALVEEVPPEEPETEVALVEEPPVEETPVEEPPVEEPPAEALPETDTSGSYDYTYTLIPADERPPEGTPPAAELTPTVPPPAVTVPVEPPPVSVTPDPAVPQVFSVPAVGRLESGKFYLQLGAFSKVDAVERELAKSEKNYPLAVQSIASGDKSVYRILIGPINHGESGALLKNFKTLGYKDAFIRKGE